MHYELNFSTCRSEADLEAVLETALPIHGDQGLLNMVWDLAAMDFPPETIVTLIGLEQTPPELGESVLAIKQVFCDLNWANDHVSCVFR